MTWKRVRDIDTALSVVLNNAAEITGAFREGRFPEHECFEDGVQEMIASILKIDFSLFHGGELPERWRRHRKPTTPKGSTKEINCGERVRTTQDAGRTDWVEGAREECRWGAEGVVLKRITGHGLCYRVLHEDGAEATYDCDEVVRLNSEDLLDVSYIKWRIEENIPHILWDEDRPRERIVAALRQVADGLEKEDA